MFLLNKFRFYLLIAFSCLFVISKSDYLTEESQRLEKYAEALKASLNEAVNPCEHFLEYVNGSKPEDLSLSKKTFDYIYEYIKKQDIIHHEERLIKNYYLSCKNVPDNYFDAIKDFDIKNEILSFPILDRYWANYNYSLAVFEAKLLPYGASLFISGEAIKTKNGDYKFNIEPADTHFKLSEDRMIEILRHYAVDWDQSIDIVYDEIKEFENNYRQVKKDYGKVLNPFEDSKKMTLGELKEKYPNFIWDQYFAVIAGGKPVGDNTEISVKYEDKLDYFYKFYPSKVNRTVALYYFLNLHAFLEGEHSFSKYRCAEHTIYALNRVITNEVLENFVNYHDAINFIDTAAAIMKTHDVITNTGLHLKAVHELVSKKDDFSKYVTRIYGDISAKNNNYFSNYAKIMAANKINAVPEEFTSDFREALHILTFAHLKPRLVLPAIWGLSHFYKFKDAWISEPSVCTDLYRKQFNIKTVMDFMDNIEQLDNEKYQNEVNTLAKFDLTPKKLLFLFLGQDYASHLKDTTEFQNTIRTMKAFNNEFNCPIDSATSELYNKCKYL